MDVFQFSIEDILILSGAIISLLLAFAFLLRKITTANVLIALFLLICFFRLWLKYLDESGLLLSLPHFSKFNYFFGFLTPPIFYLYFKYFLKRSPFSAYDLWHLIIPVLILVYFMPYYLLSSAEKIEVLSGQAPLLNVYLPDEFMYFSLFYSLAYLVAAYRLKYTYTIPSKASVWLYLLLSGYALFMIMAVIDATGLLSLDLNYRIFQLLSIVIIGACLKLLSMPNTVNEPIIKYKNIHFSPSEKSKYLNNLQVLMSEKKIYQEQDLRLSSLAQQMNLTENELSQLINDNLKSSFNDFVNQHRVDHAKKLLLDPGFAHLSIEGIAYESGFRSRTSFYNSFKSIVGTTPREYKLKTTLKSI